MHKPAEAAFHDPAAREHDKAFLSWVTFDHTMAHAVPVRPLVTGCSREGPVQDRLPQAGPCSFARIKSLKRVAILHRGGDDRDGQPGAIGINQGHALAPEHLLSGIVPTWPPRTGMHLTDCVSMMLRRGLARRPIARRRRRATSPSTRSNSPCS